MYKITLRYGLSRVIDVDVEPGTTIGAIIGNSNNLALLGAPESVTPVVNGVAVSEDQVAQPGDTILLEKQAAKKA